MEFQRVNRTDPERIFLVVKNSWSTASLAANQWVSWDLITDRDGVAVTKPAGELRYSIAGVAVETVANGDYGLIQVWGYRVGARCSGGSGLVTSKVSSGTVLVCKTAGFAVAAAHSSITVKPYHLFAAGLGIVPTNTAAKATSATTWVGNVFVRCL
ncbi:MAG TPA: hypothetical protein VI729_06180 [Anaerolineales bacterium]|nr:hypothetical protein [Anaerolineales bacterium]